MRNEILPQKKASSATFAFHPLFKMHDGSGRSIINGPENQLLNLLTPSEIYING